MRNLFSSASILVFLASVGAASAHSDEDHGDTAAKVEQMMQEHAGHDHSHDFEALDELSENDLHRALDLLEDVGLALPPTDSHAGKELFLNKGCIACHRIGDVGGEIGPAFNAADMASSMHVLEFAARMWRGAPAMVSMQEDLFGEMISLTGQELADITAFVHDADQQAEVSLADVPARFREIFAD